MSRFRPAYIHLLYFFNALKAPFTTAKGNVSPVGIRKTAMRMRHTVRSQSSTPAKNHGVAELLGQRLGPFGVLESRDVVQ